MLEEVEKQQNQASDPKYSIWTNASAGSGKTTVLVQRLLKMFLSGINLSKILCITFTNTGASEMRNRINKKLASWVILSDEELKKEMLKLNVEEEELNEKMIIARNLFAKILDESNDFKVLTIHSFCQQIIKRFPLEANIIPNFKIADNILSNELLLKAKDLILNIQNEELKEAIKFIFTYTNEEDFLKILEKAMSQKEKLLYLLENKFFSIEGILKQISKVMNLNENENIDEMKNKFLKETDLNIFHKEFMSFLKLSSTITDINFANKMEYILKNGLNNDTKNNYISLFMTKDMRKRVIILTKEVYKRYPEIKDILVNEQDRIYNFIEKIGDTENFKFTASFLKVIYCIFNIYSTLKKENGCLDYNDLIFETTKLLNDTKYKHFYEESSYSSWINYKLDESIEHILVDEAQDTSPIQWEIIKSITEEFFSGLNARGDDKRTIFVVGDEKQSIFSFQGAEPSYFKIMLNHYKKLATESNKPFLNISLQNSFRTTKTILNLVDEIFKDLERKNAISEISSKIEHFVIRNDTIGRVELWPLIGKDIEEKGEKKEKEKSIKPWKIDYTESLELSNKQQLANIIATKIENWFLNGKIIYSKKDGCKRKIKYSDIMILFRNRSDKDFINYLIRSLNKRKIPNMGNDKFDLKNNIILQDIIAMFKFILFHEDDLNLANILKSPFLNLTEEDLYKICDYKNKYNCSLWQALQKNYLKQSELLLEIIQKSKELPLYEFIFFIFEIKKMRKLFQQRFSHNAGEIINEFLNITNKFEKEHNNSTLLNFLFFLENTKLEIQREIDDNRNEVKILTIHSAKGLESPILFLPNTNHDGGSISKLDSLLMYKIKGADYELPLIYKNNTSFIANIKEGRKEEVEKEYLRLLYVALTRAENELYICDYKKIKKQNEKSWYAILQKVILQQNCKKTNFSNLLTDISYLGEEEEFEKPNDTEKNIDIQKNEKMNEIITILNSKISAIKSVKIINPSIYYANRSETNISSNSNNLANGIIVHKLLQILLNTKKEEWNDIFNLYLQNNKDYDTIKNNVLNILTNEKFSFLFNKNSQAEVPIFAKLNGNIISGRIDRISFVNKPVVSITYENKILKYIFKLVNFNNLSTRFQNTLKFLKYQTTRRIRILLLFKFLKISRLFCKNSFLWKNSVCNKSNDEIYIVDYKYTDIYYKEIPEKYIQQLSIYKQVMQKIYPNKKIKCFILWTNFGTIAELEK